MRVLPIFTDTIELAVRVSRYRIPFSKPLEIFHLDRQYQSLSTDDTLCASVCQYKVVQLQAQIIEENHLAYYPQKVSGISDKRTDRVVVRIF